MNPDAANKKTTASGLGQIMNGTFKQYGPRGANIFDLDSNAEATVRYYQHCRNIAAKEKGLTGDDLDVGAYQCYHDGEGSFRKGKDKHGKDIYNNEIKNKKGIPHAVNDDSSRDDSGSDADKVAEATGQDSDRTTLDRRQGDASQSKDESRKYLASNTVYSDAPNEALQSALREARKPTDVERATDAMKLREAPAGFPDAPLQHAMDALGVKPGEVQFTPAEADNENEAPASFDTRDNDTSEKIGSYAGTPTGCEMTAGDRKVVADRISGSDVNLETYARNDEGDFELLRMSRIGANDGITVRRPFAFS